MGELPLPAVSSKLFTPAHVGRMTLAHRIVYAPLTRLRANGNGVHGALAVEHYSQRASVPGTLLITEATVVAPFAAGRGPNSPGIWNDEQVAAWKKVSDAVHAKGSYIFMQIWALGRAARPEYIREKDPGFPLVSASDIPIPGRDERPRPLTIPEIKEYAAAFAQGAKNAVERAGFDGVEIHGANGYLVDQFTQDVSNVRTDAYGGSVENRCRFALEMVDAVCTAVGASRTAIRLSPWSSYQGMRMADPVPTFSYLVSRLAAMHSDLAYIHVIEPGIVGNANMSETSGSNEFIRNIWLPRPLIAAGGFTRETAMKTANETGKLVAFGRSYISNPDLPLRLMKDLPLTDWDDSLFYIPEEPHGYIDYPFAEV